MLSSMDGVRDELVEEIRGQIARGTYLTEDRLNEAIYRLLREIMADEERVS
jgi:anti-sigma28 factor (negative regulator of flagellin synthesis)